jgi:hypothetical protein
VPHSMSNRPGRSHNDVGPTPRGLSPKGATPAADAMLRRPDQEPAFAGRGPPIGVHVSENAHPADRAHLRKLHR